jgi:hypothetical protein
MMGAALVTMADSAKAYLRKSGGAGRVNWQNRSETPSQRSVPAQAAPVAI